MTCIVQYFALCPAFDSFLSWGKGFSGTCLCSILGYILRTFHSSTAYLEGFHRCLVDFKCIHTSIPQDLSDWNKIIWRYSVACQKKVDIRIYLGTNC